MLLASIVFGVLVLAACSGDSDETSAPDSESEQRPITAEEVSITTPTTVATTAQTTTTIVTTTTTEAPRIVLQSAERGDGGPEIVELQTYLNEIGFSVGTPDGDFGRKTERAVSAFQLISGLESTGTVNRATVEALNDFSYDGLVLEAGAEGREVEELQELLAAGPFDPGSPDGEFGTRTVQAIWALEKLSGIPIDGNWGPADAWAYEQLMAGELAAANTQHEKRWVEVDLSKQILKVYDPGTVRPILITHVSSGSGVPWENEEHSGSSITPTGDFAIQRRINGWRESSLNIGRLYNPLYFVGGIAFHGASSVPLYPASHGCVRVPMHIAEYLPGELPNGTPVHVAK